MLPSPSELSYFLEVASTLNISRAAERLGISQPTLSVAIQRLEKSFGVPLLLRTKSGVKLTHAGQKLKVQAQSLVLEWERIRSDATREESELRGRYTIGCHPSVARYALPLVLPKLLQQNPNLEISLVHDLSRKITEDVISFKVDFGIVVNPVQHPDLIIKILGKDEVGLWTAAKPSPLQDLSSGSGVLIFEPDLIQSQNIVKQLGKKGMRFTRTVTSSNLEVITELVGAGVGIGILPGKVAKCHVGMPIKPYAKSSPKFHDVHCLIYRADVQKSKATRNGG